MPFFLHVLLRVASVAKRQWSGSENGFWGQAFWGVAVGDAAILGAYIELPHERRGWYIVIEYSWYIIYIYIMYWSFILIIYMKLIWQMYQDSVSVWHWSLNTGGFHSSQSLYTEFEDGSWETRFSYVHELLGVGNLSGIRWCANHKGVVSIWRSVRFLN